MPRKKNPTVADVEIATGYSRSTISRSLRGDPLVDVATRAKVLKAASVLGYVARMEIPTETRKATARIGVLLPHLDNPYYAELVQCLNQDEQRGDHMILLALHHGNASKIETLIRGWVTDETDGMILDPPSLQAYPRILDYLRARRVPTVYLHGRPDGDFCQVVHRRGPSYRRAMQQLWQLGHRRIAYIGADAGAPRLTESFVEYRSVLEANNHPVDEALLHFGFNNASTGYEGFLKLFSRRPVPTAVVCFNDILACGVAKGARLRHLRIPEDFSLVGGDNIAEAERIGLTTVQADRAQMAREVYRLLELQRQNGNKFSEKVMLETELISRTSVERPPEEEVLPFS